MDNANIRLRNQAKALFRCAVDRADPARALRRQWESTPLPELPDGGTNYVVAIGKAAVPMLCAALEMLPPGCRALAVTNPENHCAIPGATVLSGAHPVPDEASAAAGRSIIALLNDAGDQDRVIALISGGGSALAVAPAEGLGLADKQAVNKLLLASGLEINEMNLIRQQLSDLKGGGFLRHAHPAPVFSFILSDVIGDDLRAIASGPTVAPIGSRKDATELLRGSGLWDQTPVAVQKLLTEAKSTTDTASSVTNTLIGSNRHSLSAALEAAADQWDARLESDHLVGDVADAAETVLSAAEAAPDDHPVALIFGGETTVRLTGNGRGGRNQELALRVAQGARTRLAGEWVFLSGGTDGRDGPTDAAGGIVDRGTTERISAAGGNLDHLLANNDSYQALKLAGDLLMTGGTGTNVADVQIFLRLPETTPL